MSYSFLKLSRDDMDNVAKIHRAAFDNQLPWFAGLHSPAEDRAFFRNRVFGECELWGAIDTELVGFIAFRSGWIDQLYILPCRQRQGVGSALIQIAKTANPKLQLWTFERNSAARAFYIRQHFVEIRQTDGSLNEEREPDILLRWPSELASAAFIVKRSTLGRERRLKVRFIEPIEGQSK